MTNKSQNNNTKALVVGNDNNRYALRSDLCSYRGARELGIEVTQYRMGGDKTVSLPRIKSLEKDLPK